MKKRIGYKQCMATFANDHLSLINRVGLKKMGSSRVRWLSVCILGAALVLPGCGDETKAGTNTETTEDVKIDVTVNKFNQFDNAALKIYYVAQKSDAPTEGELKVLAETKVGVNLPDAELSLSDDYVGKILIAEISAVDSKTEYFDPIKNDMTPLGNNKLYALFVPSKSGALFRVDAYSHMAFQRVLVFADFNTPSNLDMAKLSQADLNQLLTIKESMLQRANQELAQSLLGPQGTTWLRNDTSNTTITQYAITTPRSIADITINPNETSENASYNTFMWSIAHIGLYNDAFPSDTPMINFAKDMGRDFWDGDIDGLTLWHGENSSASTQVSPNSIVTKLMPSISLRYTDIEEVVANGNIMANLDANENARVTYAAKVKDKVIQLVSARRKGATAPAQQCNSPLSNFKITYVSSVEEYVLEGTASPYCSVDINYRNTDGNTVDSGVIAVVDSTGKYKAAFSAKRFVSPNFVGTNQPDFVLVQHPAYISSDIENYVLYSVTPTNKDLVFPFEYVTQTAQQGGSVSVVNGRMPDRGIGNYNRPFGLTSYKKLDKKNPSADQLTYTLQYESATSQLIIQPSGTNAQKITSPVINQLSTDATNPTVLNSELKIYNKPAQREVVITQSKAASYEYKEQYATVTSQGINADAFNTGELNVIDYWIGRHTVGACQLDIQSSGHITLTQNTKSVSQDISRDVIDSLFKRDLGYNYRLNAGDTTTKPYTYMVLDIKNDQFLSAVAGQSDSDLPNAGDLQDQKLTCTR